jgi:hypothetical protein
MSNPYQDSDSLDEEVEDAKSVVELAEKLIQAIPFFFPKLSAEAMEQAHLYHDGLHWNNILIDAGSCGALTTILDWECVSAAPLWKACRYPGFLLGTPRDEEPKHDEYSWPEPEKVASGEECEHVLFGEHIIEYEQTRLRPIFAEEMQKYVPNWSQVHH